MVAVMSDVQNLSRRLYDVMEEIGASEDMRRQARQTAILIEIFQSVCIQRASFVFVCGSRFESSIVYDTMSDIDFINCFTDFKIINNQHELDLQLDDNRTSFLLIRDEYTHPGYVKLQTFQYKRLLTTHSLLNLVQQNISTYRYGINSIRQGGDIDYLGRVCLKLHPIEDGHGPAIKTRDMDGWHVFDNVVALLCSRVPDFATERLRRPRRFQWPPAQLLNDMSAMGCLLVPVGHESSAERHMEWRLSFTRQERLLMSNLNPTQHKVYILLKIIRKECVQPLFGDIEVLTSYHLKTLILHTVENTPATAWTRDNIANCVIHCLNILYYWVRCGVCPNYFTKDQNLFDKKAFRHAKFRLRLKLQELLKTKYKLLTCLHTSNIGVMLTMTRDTWMYLKNKITTKTRSLLKLSLFLTTMSSDTPCVYEKVDKEITKSRGMSLLNYLKNTKPVSEHSEQETKMAFSYMYMIPWVHLYMAKQLASDSLKVSTNTREIDAFEHFRKATPTDLIQVDLAKASYYLAKRRFNDCLTLLNCVQQKWTKTTISYCHDYCKIHSCDIEKSLTRVDEQQQQQQLVDERPLAQIPSRLAGCVIFLPSHKPLTPLPLQREMKRWKLLSASRRDNGMINDYFRNARVDGIVYLYFLKYLVSKELENPDLQIEALADLRRVIKNHLGHKETAYNLLGWIYIKENRIGDAIKCFMLSWEMGPFENAAIFHMNSLLSIFCRLIRNWKKMNTKM